MRPLRMAAMLVVMGLSPALQADTVSLLLDGYQADGAGPFSATDGKSLWQRAGVDGSRRCSTCHGADLREAGRHKRTRKAIAPMSPMVEPLRLSDAKKIEKWLRRNCKWTWGRVCTPQEKGDLLSYIEQPVENAK